MLVWPVRASSSEVERGAVWAAVEAHHLYKLLACIYGFENSIVFTGNPIPVPQVPQIPQIIYLCGTPPKAQKEEISDL